MSEDLSQPLLHVSGLLKAFPGLTALDHVDLDVRSGEIVAIVGHNGSGKSTLMKILAGVYTADAGVIETAHGTELHFIHQDLALIGQLSASENLALHRGEGAAALSPYRDRQLTERARELIARFGPVFDVTCPLSALTPAQRAVVAISRAMDGWTHSRNVLFLDEPTESLHRGEVDVLFEAVRRLAAEGAGIVFVSHRLDEVRSLAHRIVGLRDGKKVADRPTAEMDESHLIEIVTGVEPAAAAERPIRERGAAALQVRGLRGGSVESIDLVLHAGEIVGVAGTLGSGREAVPSLLYGATDADADEYVVAGLDYPHPTPALSLTHGIAFAPADRGRLAIIRDLNARENFTLPHLARTRRAFAPISGTERAETVAAFAEYDVRPARTEQRISLFSGGNQQKIVMAKSMHQRPNVLLLDEPTQGVDVGAKAAIYAAIDRGAAAGTAVLVSSSDAKELALLCDRVIVMRDGRVGAELTGGALTERRLVAEAYGLP
ncbi:sugar ABC transporter ATP-binding protein [Microbacterium murale]|uniref:Ribose import ATP-binding protein RbsA n=1 Tax=Microbacterium murale TaxID=1081040 RepID=A0ABQ1RC98_9MICO|nr:sugar ABC transporter ATP-binding protein [Microbacterium murale]GGD65569.1 ribose import ATP-binding protein RbsA [Microbacterium murale]